MPDYDVLPLDAGVHYYDPFTNTMKITSRPAERWVNPRPSHGRVFGLMAPSTRDWCLYTLSGGYVVISTAGAVAFGYPYRVASAIAYMLNDGSTP